jgi:hypothetical protein
MIVAGELLLPKKVVASVLLVWCIGVCKFDSNCLYLKVFVLILV